MQVVVEIMMGTIFHIQVGENATVLDLKIAIHNQENVPADRLILLLDIGDDHLMMNDDQKPLSEYGVQDGSRFQVIFKPLEAKKHDDDKDDDDDNKDDDDKNDDDNKDDDDKNDDDNKDDDKNDDDNKNDDDKNDDDDTGDDKVMDKDRTESETEDDSDDNRRADDSSSSAPKTPYEETTVESPEYISISD